VFEVFAQQDWTVPRAPWWVPLIAPMVLLALALMLVVATGTWRHRRAVRRRDTRHDAVGMAVARDHASELAALRDRQDAETAGLVFGEPLHG